ncbi:septum site-determining protein Ssd [Pseudarthrobacter sp. PS3-L1]|uniref:septum site-determining protein Ssd n=1 Tax=Pseudarthrobacter sp. PS3-L1 TaxID=3046207 RepID=UPI0024BB75E1|nr:septum site-determining protein Ssd [Pseudarthrobacter sp. PS3-L1]MDJ0319214.1 hypothetical protein [Pseudarthrobacter sp. PS3-L1]
MRRHQQPVSGPEAAAPRAEVLLVTGFEVLRAEVERIVAAGGGRLRCVTDTAEAWPFWDRSLAVLVGSDIREIPPRWRVPAAVVGLSGEGDSLWHLAAALGAQRVAVLPDAAVWLAEFLSGTRAPDAGGLVLGVIGGCGGAGATTSGIWIAQVAAGLGISVLLVDGDPWGGGLELAIAAEESPGLRWPDLAAASGGIDPDQLSQSMPVAGGFAFLSWRGSRERQQSPPQPTVSGVMEAARRAYELVVVDIGRSVGSAQVFGWDCDRLLLVAPAQLKAAVSCARLLQELPPIDIGLVVRGKAGPSFDADTMAEAVGIPLRGVLPEIRGTSAAMETGTLLQIGRRRPVERFATTVLDLVGDHLPGTSA